MPNAFVNHCHEYLGKTIKIMSSSNSYNLNKCGVIVNETKNMIYLVTSQTKRLLKISKSEIDLFQVSLPSGNYIIDGKRLIGRPEEIISKTR